MGLGVSLLLIAVGAILKYAVDIHMSGIDLNAVGVILMAVGAIGLVLSLFFWSTWGGFGGYRRRDVIEDDGVGSRRRRVYEDEVV